MSLLYVSLSASLPHYIRRMAVRAHRRDSELIDSVVMLVRYSGPIVGPPEAIRSGRGLRRSQVPRPKRASWSLLGHEP